MHNPINRFSASIYKLNAIYVAMKQDNCHLILHKQDNSNCLGDAMLSTQVTFNISRVSLVHNQMNRKYQKINNGLKEIIIFITRAKHNYVNTIM